VAATPLPIAQIPSDSRLVAQARAGSADAFRAIVRRYERPLRAYCTRLLGPDLATDAVQQTFLHALIALRSAPPREIALRPWLYRVARNCALDLLRRPDHGCRAIDPGLRGGAEPADVIEQREAIDEMLALLRALPEAQRLALTMREVEGRSYREIAARLGRTPAGARQAIFRARSALRADGAIQTPGGRMSEDPERELRLAAALWQPNGRERIAA
jgi:RNA polymerase sigma factor (sigma-70 family)